MKNLKCRLQFKRQSHLFSLSPLKIEEHSHSPPIWQIYDLLTENLTNAIISRMKSSMFRSSIGGTTDAPNSASEVRTSSSGWLSDNFNDSDILIKIPRLVEQLTDLTLLQDPFSSEIVQISSYGVNRNVENPKLLFPLYF